MRQIKFRVWDTTEKEYKGLHGCPTCGSEYYNLGDKEYIFEQFTGLLDKNGVEIYEGSVIQECVVGQVIWDGDGIVEECPCAEVIIGTVFTNIGQSKTGRVRLLKSSNLGKKGESVDLHMTTYDGLYQWPEGFEVIGNIHSNPGLLEAKNEA